MHLGYPVWKYSKGGGDEEGTGTTRLRVSPAIKAIYGAPSCECGDMLYIIA